MIKASGGAGLSVAGTIVTLIYLLDVRPAVRGTSGGTSGPAGPYGPW